MMHPLLLSISLILLALSLSHSARAQGASEPARAPLRVAVAGLSHGHVNWILGRPDRGDIEVVGIYEPDRALAERYAARHGFPMSLVYDDLDAMLDAVKPEAVTAFNPVGEHLEVVEACAPRGIHVMVEKPLAATLEQARAMAALARRHGIHLLTNYETTWYGSTHEAYRLIREEEAIGAVRKIVVHDGHQGPKEIGVGPEFLTWLTDPVRNGGGAVIDFGCYGANLVTWLLRTAPTSVTAVLQQMKPEVYPEVDDEATIVLTYPGAQGIIQASWNWPFARKDLEVYGQTGYVHTVDGEAMRIRLKGDRAERSTKAGARPAPQDDPFAYLAAVVRGDLVVEDYDLSALPNNLIVMQILEAAKVSARTGRTVALETLAPQP